MAKVLYLVREALCHSIRQTSIMACNERAEHFLNPCILVSRLYGNWEAFIVVVDLLFLWFFFAYGRLVGLLWMGMSKVTYSF